MLVVRCLFQLWTLPLIRHYPTESDTSHSARVATPSSPARKATSLMKCPMTNAQGPKKLQYPNAKPCASLGFCPESFRDWAFFIGPWTFGTAIRHSCFGH